MIFETHAHYDDERFSEDRDILLGQKLKEEGIDYIVNVAADMDSVYTTDALTKQYEWVYGALGVHPEAVDRLTVQDLEEIGTLIRNNPKICAVGEIGFDFSEGYPEKDIQEKWFRAQIDLAGASGLPIVVHSRGASEDTWRVLRDCYRDRSGKPHGIIHCFSYSAEEAMKYISLGFMIGVGGVVTFKNGKKLKAVVQAIPLESVVLETDSPYLAPDPHRGERNSSLNLPFVAAQIAELKGITPEAVCEQTMKNAKNLYRIN